MKRARWLLALPALLIATSGAALASEIRDKAGMFGAEAVRKAQTELDRIEREYQVPVTIETVESLNGKTVDEVLVQAGVAASEVDRMFLTGGTSFVPAIRRLFVERFGAERLTSADQFESIAYGLALIGRTPEPDRWTVPDA